MRFSYILILVFLATVHSIGQTLDPHQIYLADPTIFEDNGTYYLYGTKGDPTIQGEGFLVYTSQDLENWEGPCGTKGGFALKKGDAFGDKGFWAPQVFKYRSKYYMAYTANEHIAIATSNSPLGPFTNDMKALDAPVKQIDPFVFFDNGKAYLYHVRLQEGNRIFVAEMNADLESIKPGTLRECIHAEKTWENTENAEWPVAEGPTVFKKDGLYYLLYSANDFRNPDYAVGYATSENPLGPWKKAAGNPIISRDKVGYPGMGHGDLFYNGNGEMMYVLHAHFSEDKVSPRKTGTIKLRLINGKIEPSISDFKWVLKRASK
jgi:beta-xylosidase